MNYEFRLVLANRSEVSVDDANALYQAGCDDATFGSCDGVAFGDFDRDAPSLEQAIRSAIADVRRAGLGVSRIENVEQMLIDGINSELSAA